MTTERSEVTHSIDLGDINLASRNNKTPLYKAVKYENKHIFDELIAQTAIDLNLADNTGTSPLHLAAALEDEHYVNTLIVKGASTDAKDQDGRIPLHVAALAGIVANLTSLVENTKNPNQTDKQQNTIAHLACTQKPTSNEDAIKMLLGRTEISFTTKNIHSKTPLTILLENNTVHTISADTLEQMLEASKTILNQTMESPILAAFPKHTAVHSNVLAAFFKRDDIKFDITDTEGNTPLLRILSNVRLGDIDSASLSTLLKKSNPNHVNRAGDSALSLLLKRDDFAKIDVVFVLELINASKPDYKDNNANSELMLLISHQDIVQVDKKIVDALFDRSDLTKQNKQQETALTMALGKRGDSFPAVRLSAMLTALQTDKKPWLQTHINDKTDAYGNTLLTSAVHYHRADLASLLISAGADTNAKYVAPQASTEKRMSFMSASSSQTTQAPRVFGPAETGDSVLHYAVRAENTELASLALQTKPDCAATVTAKNHTAAVLAVKMLSQAMARVLYKYSKIESQVVVTRAAGFFKPEICHASTLLSNGTRVGFESKEHIESFFTADHDVLTPAQHALRGDGVEVAAAHQDNSAAAAAAAGNSPSLLEC